MRTPSISLRQARRLALLGQGLAGDPLRDIAEVIGRLGAVQRDPTAAVAPTEELVLWSRLGSYQRGELSRLMYDERRLVDYWVHVVKGEDLTLHFGSMRRYPHGQSARARYVRAWLAANRRFERYVLGEVKRRGPLRSRDLEDRADVPWKTGGWNDGKSLGRMLDALWFSGKLAIVGRSGRERIWDLASRHPAYTQPPTPAREVARRLAANQLLHLGIARAPEIGVAFDGPAAGAARVRTEMVRSGEAVEVGVEGLHGSWLVHTRLLESEGQPRTTLLSPFDNLIANRRRAEQLFGFRFRLEIYQPPERRRHGYFVMPLLHGDELIARAEVRRDRTTGRIETGRVHAEPSVDPRFAADAFNATASRLEAWLSASG